MEERKYVCKYCSKRFPCGKSLGGHIRTHMMMTEERSNVVDGGGGNNMFIKLDGVRNNKKKKKRDLWCEDEYDDEEEDDDDDVYDVVGNNHPIYGLRENPKKTMRFVHSSSGGGVNNGEQQQKEDKRFCKECGKGFPSLKALCGHMACHSEKEKRTTTMRFEEVSDDKKKVKLVMDSQSDTETCAPTTHPRRSKRMKVKTINLSNHTFSPPPPPPSSLVPLANSSSPVSEVEQEQEEVARCLMLLSRDSGFKGRFASVTESSDNNSVILEAKSSSPDTRIAVRNGNHNNNNVVSNHAYDLVEKKLLKVKDTKLKSNENSGSRCFRYGPKTKMVDSDISNNDELKWPKLGDKSRKYTASVVKKLVMEDLDYDTTDETTRRLDSRERSLVGVSSNKIANGFGNEVVYNENSRKGWKHEFLEGERDMNGSYDSIQESDENSSETESFPAPRSHKSKGLNGNQSSTKAKKKKKKFKSKKSKEHECPICYKIFKSGQALGGHKRSHFIGGSEENTVVIKHVAPCLIDLNLPAPVDE